MKYDRATTKSLFALRRLVKYQRERVNIHQQETPTIRDIASDDLSPTREIRQEANRAVRADDEIEPLIQRIRQVIDIGWR